MNDREFLKRLCELWAEKAALCASTPVGAAAGNYYNERVLEAEAALQSDAALELRELRRYYTVTDVVASSLSESLPPEAENVTEVGILLMAGKMCEWPPEETAKLCGQPVDIVREYNAGKRPYWEIKSSVETIKALHRFGLLRLPGAIS